MHSRMRYDHELQSSIHIKWRLFLFPNPFMIHFYQSHHGLDQFTLYLKKKTKLKKQKKIHSNRHTVIDITLNGVELQNRKKTDSVETTLKWKDANVVADWKTQKLNETRINMLSFPPLFNSGRYIDAIIQCCVDRRNQFYRCPNRWYLWNVYDPFDHYWVCCVRVNWFWLNALMVVDIQVGRVFVMPTHNSKMITNKFGSMTWWIKRALSE